MKVVLTSCGIINEDIKNKFYSLLDKKIEDIKLLYITTAIDGDLDDDKSWVEDEFESILNLGIKKENITEFKLDKNIDFNKYDAIYMIGGNTFYLLKKLREYGVDKIKEAINNGIIYIGSSAGSEILGTTIETALPYDDNNVSLTDYAGLNIIDSVVIPHANRKAEFIKEQIKKYNKITTLYDGDGIIFYGDDNPKVTLYNYRKEMLKDKKMSNNLTIISNTCIGGRLYHDYGEKFLSPTIDFYMEPRDFVKFCCNLEYYLKCEIKPLPDFKLNHLSNFLFCDIGGLLAAFGHTNDSYEKIGAKWNERKQRVNYDNIVVICTDRNVLVKPFIKCSENTIKEFGKIPYKKVLFSIVDYRYDYVSYLPSFKQEDACPEATRPSLTKKGKYIIEEDGFDLDKFVQEG